MDLKKTENSVITQ